MKKYFALEITDFCTRECSHCIVDSTSKGKSLAIEDIKTTIAQIAELVKKPSFSICPDSLPNFLNKAPER